MTRAATSPGLLPGLTGARAVAAWFVVLYHLRTGYGDGVPGWLLAILDKGYLAVDFFFMLSGFVLWRNYGARLRTAGAAGIPDFLWRRVARIWPLHALILVLAALFAMLLGVTHRQAGHYPWADWPLHLLMMQSWGFSPTLRWNDPAWSISCEWAAYLLFPLLALAIDWGRYATHHLIAAIVGLVLLLAMLFAHYGFNTLGGTDAALALPRALVGFAIGTILSTLHDRGAGPTAVWLAAVPVCAGALGFGLTETLGVPLLLAASLLLLARFAAAPANPLAHPIAVYLGEISYATYLFHFLGFVWFKLLFVTNADSIPFGLITAFLGITLAMSMLLYHGVELPAQTALRRRRTALPRRTPATGRG
ncbi:MAG TPA: acyltransferase [Sphingomonas sp.]|jgi:peptidoglycan/LPS O-acetylase OafA/YrhL|uniref:acyltransferase family protein n=1 Tax=Sphingomonas sp. TaxID=28214 RepID=UPI002ED91448